MASVEELIKLFAGEFTPDGFCLSEPFPTVALGVEICRKVRPASLGPLLEVVFGDTAWEQMSWRQKTALTAGFMRWEKRERKARLAGRGL